jgi:hypothetical protein
MAASTYEVAITGEILERGFWIYVWEATTPKDEALLYVGMTGDNSSVNAQSPFHRMGQHLGWQENTNMMRRHLTERQVVPEECSFRFFAHGPVHPEAENWGDHEVRRDAVLAVERRLIEDLGAAGYDVMNTSNSKMHLDEAFYGPVRTSFSEHFSDLGG